MLLKLTTKLQFETKDTTKHYPCGMLYSPNALGATVFIGTYEDEIFELDGPPTRRARHGF